ncbi:MAG TPA: M24 family metallopeptidase, partial [Ilumatobacteraceae bacterium]|nr:M24 family metallopeptidase [Ilumatobacteraceae bacterium]
MTAPRAAWRWSTGWPAPTRCSPASPRRSKSAVDEASLVRPRWAHGRTVAAHAAGHVVAEMHAAIRAAAAPGVTTAALDQVARDVLVRCDATSNFLGYHGFPAVICASVNDEVVHGLPGDRPLADGDLLSIDCGAVVHGWHGDAAFSMVIGGADANPAAAQLIAAAERALAAGIAAMVPGGHVGDIGAAIDSVVRAAGYGRPRDYC